MKQSMEMTFFKLISKDEVREFELCSKNFHEFVRQQDGFISRKLVLDEEGRYGDIVVWKSLDHARAIDATMGQSDVALAYMKFIDMHTIEMKHVEIIQE